jgi:hypothetical protein
LDTEEWSRLLNPREVSSLFIKVAAVPANAASPLNYVPNSSSGRQQATAISPEDEDFVAKYFGEGIRPVIWVDATRPEDKIWEIVSGLWPALRRSFSACTLCLQPRSLQNRMFEVMFCPRTVNARFSRFNADHFVVSSPAATEPWQHDLAMQLFGSTKPDLGPEILKAALDDNPISVRKLFLFRELWSRSAEKPSAAIGALDLLESFHVPDATAELQRTVLDRALSSFDSLAPTERLELFSMLIHRISRVHTNGFKEEGLVTAFLDLLVKDVLASSPDVVLSEVERAWPRLKDDSGFKAGFMKTLADALAENRALGGAISGRPDIAKEFFIEYPSVFGQALNSPESGMLRDQMLEWLNDASFRQRISGLRIQLLGGLKPQTDTLLVTRMLTDIHEGEVEPVLNILFERNGLPYQNHESREAVIDMIARPFPVLTRRWIESSDHRDDVAAEILAATYSAAQAEYRNILVSTGIDSTFKGKVFASWIIRNSAHNPKFVRQLAEWVSHDPGILELLVEPHLGESGGKALEVIVGAVGLVQTVPRSLVERVFQSQSNNHRLIDVVIRGAVLEFVRSGKNPEILDAVVGHATFAEWLGGKNWKLTALVKGGVSDRESCSRGWQVIYALPNSANRREIVVGTIESLMGVTAEYCSLDAVHIWVQVIRRSRGNKLDRTFEPELCGQAIRFAFENSRLPVSELAVEAFLPLYKSVTEAKFVPSTANSLFSFWNWDKGAELREALVERSLAGDWPPGDVALAVGDFALLRKILKRMSRRVGGQSLARRMYSDLASRNDSQARALANGLSSLLKSPDYDEEWD